MKALLVVLAVVVLVGLHSVTAHTWIDCFDTNYTKIYDDSASYIYGGSGGNGFCDGYGAGYPGRGDTDIGTEYTFKMLENEVEAGTDVCQTVDADTYTSTDWRTRISVAPGQTVYFAYLPNGHIVKDKKAIGTQHGIYWTGQVGTSLTSTLDMTTENLMDGYTLDFDDGNCGESVDNEGNPGGRAGDGKPCIGTFVVPTGTAAGVYSMVWYWTFWLDNEASYVDQSQARGYFGAAYSTCFEVEVTSGSGSSTAATEAPSTDAPQATTATPQSTTAAPQSTTASPAVTTATPTSTAPVATTETPALTTSTPDTSSVTSWDQVDAASAAGDADPTATTSAPVSTTSAPTATTSAPQVTTAAPVVATAAPVVTTAAPVVTQTEAPVTTSPPVQVTDAPATEAPAQTTSAPQATTTAVTAAPATPAQTTSAPEAVTDAPTTEAPSTPETTVAAPTATPKIDTTSAEGSDESEDGYSSLKSATFSSLSGDDASAGTVHAASLGFSSSTSSSSSADNSISSDSSTAKVGSGSFAIEPEVSYDSASASASSESSPPTTSSASSSTASASTNAETSFALKSSQSQSCLVLLCIFIAAVAV